VPLALPLVLGPAAAPDLHPGRAADHLGTGPAQPRRTPGAHGHARPRPAAAGQAAGAAAAGRQGGYISAELDDYLHARGADLLRPSYRNRPPRPGQALLAPIRQLIESVYDTLKGQLDLELHGGRSLPGVAARVAQRILALTAAIWHNRTTGQPITRSLIAYDH
jgi:hypothetical protein